MANIRKTFNFREGVKVDDSVLVVAGERVGIGTTVPAQVLDVRGKVTITGDVDYSNSVTTGISTFGEVRLGTGVTISSLSGIITANYYYGDGSTLTNLPTSQWTDTDAGLGYTSIYANGTVGVGTTNPQHTFQVGSNPNDVGGKGVGINSETGDIRSSGIITATSFVGDGSSITSLNGTNISSGTVAAARVATLNQDTTGTAALAEGLTGTPNVAVNDITSVRYINSTGIITATSFDGDFNGNAATAEIALGIATALDYVAANINAGVGSFGAIGIGTTNPVSDIQIVNTGNSKITLGRSEAIDGNSSTISFGNDSATFPYSNSYSLDIVNYGIGNVNFHLEAGTPGIGTGDFNWIRRKNYDHLMVLTYGGSLGLGVTIPDNTLHVVGTSTITGKAYFGNEIETTGDLTTKVISATGLNVSSSIDATLNGNVYAASGVSTFTKLKFANSGGIGIGADAPGGGGIAINSDTTKRITLDSSGNIGIKTVSDFDGIDALQTETLIGGVGVGTTTPSSVVDFGDAGLVGIVTTNRFIIPPKLTDTQRGLIAAPQAGALIYNTTTNKLNVYNGSAWRAVTDAAV